jgi:hypothetical protein
MNIASKGMDGPAAPGPWTRAGAVAALACAAFGALISVLPHLTMLARTGDASWVGSRDDMFYTGVGAQAYYQHPWKTGDPALPSGGPSIYKPLPLVPGILIARALGTGPTWLALIWRLWGGIITGVSLYAFFGHFLRRPAVAAAATLWMLADAGWLDGRPIVTQVVDIVRIATGRTAGLLDGIPRVLYHWRLGTPSLTTAYLLLAVILLDRARCRDTRPRLVAAGVGFALLFYVYFYYWTAAVIALGLAWALDPGWRWTYVKVGLVALAVALPSLVADVALKRSTPPDWLTRSDKFLTIGHLAELQIPRVPILVALATLPVVLRWRRDLLFAWGLTAGGLALLNEQVITAFYIENWHWIFSYGIMQALLLVVLALGAVEARGGWTPARLRALWTLAAVMMATGLGLRAVEATRSAEALKLTTVLERYRAQRLAPDAPRLEALAIVAGDVDFVEFAAIAEHTLPFYGYIIDLSPTIKDAEWDERIALHGYLLGQDRPGFERAQRLFFEGDGKGHKAGVWGPWARDKGAREAKIRARLAAYERVAADPRTYLDRYRVRYLALAAGQGPPPPRSGWERLQDGPTWALWARRVAETSPGRR